MDIKKYIGVIILTFCFTIPVEALEMCTPTKEYTEYQKLSKEEKQKYQEPIFCSEIVENKTNTSFMKGNLYPKLYTSYTDQTYNSYQDGKTTSPKNQYGTGLCWNFAAIATVESNALKKGLPSFDLSESHLAYSILGQTYTNPTSQNEKYDTDTNGGKITYAPSYFYGGYGQLTETELPFASNLIYDTNYNDGTQTLRKITTSTYKKGRDIVTLDNFYLDNYNSSGKCSTNDISTIKKNIIKYGSVLATMYMDQSLFKDSDEEYYLATSSDGDYSNHGIVIIGWDDTISKTNFNNATRDGAWIIKNSWGDDWSSDGFFYISYDDYFICNLIANYEVSNETKSYENTYKSSAVMGIPLIQLQNTIYTASKFTKKTDSSINETIEKISFAVGEYMDYTVYLSKDNNLTNQTNWIQLDTGNSSLYGMKSVNLNNIDIDSDFTIIVKYVINSNEVSSVFTTCNYFDETKNLDYKTNTNFISENGTNWSDLANISIGGTSIKCQPNLYAYTNEKSKIEVENSTVTDNSLTVDLQLNDVDTNTITYKVTNSNNEDISSHFIITEDYEHNRIVVTSDNTIDGSFTLSIISGTTTRTTDFELVENVSVVDNTKMSFQNTDLYTVIGKNESFTYEKLTGGLTLKNTALSVKDAKNINVDDDSTKIGTGSTITTNNNTYKLIVEGDSTGDGKINSGDLLRVINHLKGTTTLDESQFLAADCDNNGKINSGDLLRIINFLKGTYTITIRG